MCFSAEADLVGGIVIGAIGVDVLRHLHGRMRYAPLASMPLLFAAHQFDEAFVWWGLQGDVSAGVGRFATWIYLIFAFVILPILVPAAILVLEPPGRRRRMIVPFVGLGAIVSAVLLAAMIRGPVDAELGSHYIAYSTDLRADFLVVALYVVATCGSLIFSGIRPIAVFGVLNLIVVAALAQVTLDGFASLWCAWAAISSAAFAVHLRFGVRPPRSYATVAV